jgi:hypothetical protein
MRDHFIGGAGGRHHCRRQGRKHCRILANLIIDLFLLLKMTWVDGGMRYPLFIVSS